MKANKDFLWYKEGDEIKDEDSEHFSVWKKSGLISDDKPVQKKESVKTNSQKIDLDLNNDGKVDAKDRSIAGKFLQSKKGRLKKSK